MPRPEPPIVTIKGPFAVRKRIGRKLVLAPDGAPNCAVWRWLAGR